MSTVSVVIPTYNRAHLLPRAVASVLAQLEAGDELIVVDDGSTDGTEAVLGPWRERLRYLRVENGGAGQARNLGWRTARGELVGLLDSDDEWLPGKLRLQRTLLDACPELVFCWTDFTTRTAEGELIPRNLASWLERPRPWEAVLGAPAPYSVLTGTVPAGEDPPVYRGEVYLPLLRDSCAALGSSLVRRALVPDGLRCAEDLPTYEDWEAVARLAVHGPGAFIAADLQVNHGHAGPRLSAARHLPKIEARLAILRRVWGEEPAFLARHGAEYRALVEGLELLRARELLAQGRSGAARAALAAVGGGPLSYRLLALVPEAWLRAGMSLRRLARKGG